MKRVCPVCDIDKSTVLYEQGFSGNITHKIALCNNCGFIFVQNSHDQKYYNTYYQKMSKYELERDHLLHQKYFTILNKFINKSSRILDSGCSTGHLLSLFKKNGYKNLKGIDPSLECKIIAKKKFGISVSAQNLYEYSSGKKYDCIILAMVLEHLVDVKGVIEKTKKLLSKDGIVFISVPDAANFYIDFKEPFGEFSIEHINFYSSYHLSQIMNNFNCVFLESDGKNLFSVWKKHTTLEESMNKYITLSNKKLRLINNVIDKLPSRMIVWGVGSLLHRLLTTTQLRKKIIKFVDSDKKLHGKKIDNIDILSPNELTQYASPILICSFRFREEIAEYIRLNKIPNKVITF